MSETIAIIGAGVAGLTAARILSHRGARIAIFEKSRGIGGRLSTRRTDFGGIDHGTPYLETDAPKFRALLTGLNNLGSLTQWEPEGKNNDAIWHVGMPSMSGLLKPMAEQTRIHYQTEVKGIAPSQNDNGKIGVDIAFDVAANNDGGDNGDERQVAVSHFDRVILAIPAPQAARLLAQSGPAFDAIKNCTMSPCWTGLFAFDAPIDALQKQCLKAHQDVDWLGHNGSKPDRTPGTYVMHMSQAFSQNHLEAPRDQMAEKLLAKLGAIAGSELPTALYAKAHRWRFARTDKALGKPFLANDDATISTIGDWCLGPKAEHAFESARLLTEHLKEVSSA